MSITVQCPSCQVTAEVEAPVGSTVQCANCGESVPVPAAAPPAATLPQPTGRKRTVSFDASPVAAVGAPAAEPAPAAAPAATPDTSLSDPFIGKEFGGYCIEKRLGKGDRVDVYLAYHGELGTPVTIKLLKPAFAEVVARDENALFEQVRRRMSLQHDNILQIQDTNKANERYYLITEYVDGPRLEDLLDREGAFPPDKAIDMTLQLCQALQAAHAHGICPTGINPYNTLVDKTGVMKASVFGMGSVVAAEDTVAFEDASPDAAQYVAPELTQGRGDARSDTYALGCILYRMLCGKPPYAGAEREAVMQQHVQAPVPDPHAAVSTLPRNLADCVMQMLAKNPDERPASAEAVVTALKGLSGEAPPPTVVLEDTRGLAKLLARMVEFQASDLHLKAKAPPVFRIRGETQRLNAPPFTKDQLQALIYEVLSPDQIEVLTEKSSVDLSFTLEGIGRYRINAFKQKGALSACIRRVSATVPTIDQMLLPPAVSKIASYKDGMVLTTGATGSGKTTTLAIIIDLINQSRRGHILTIEDPIEFLHEDKLSIVTQREIGLDTPNFLRGLRDALRQDPDVILIGELRDMETMETALSASETGHMVLGTLHANTATETIQRILNFFPFDRHDNLRQLLGNTLRAVIAQRIIAGCQPDRPRVAAVELLFVNDVIRQCITDGEDARIYRQFEVFAQEGFQSLNMGLYKHVVKGLVHREIALRESPNPKELEKYLGGAAR